MQDQFDNATDTYRKIAEFEGRLLLVWPRNETEVTTSVGTGAMIEADVAVLDGPDAGAYYSGVGIFPKVLVSRLRRNLGTGRPQLGRLGRGEAKRGQSAPWELAPATEAERAVARTYLDNPTPSTSAQPRKQTHNQQIYGALAAAQPAFTDEPPF